MTRSAWRLLTTRLRSCLAQAEVARFDSAIRLYNTNDRVDEYNFNRLVALNKPVIVLQATGSGHEHHKVTAREAGNLEWKLPLSIGCRVMLTENLWTPRKLTNGATGEVIDIV